MSAFSGNRPYSILPIDTRLTATTAHHTPWHVVPDDDKENARPIVSQIVLDALNDLNMAYPKTTGKRRRELKAIRKQL